MDAAQLARLIDHTLLKPEATAAQIETLCAEAIANGFASVCVNGVFVPLAVSLLQDHPSAVCMVVGFPLGAMHTEIKVAEARLAVAQGATEVDMVIHVGALKAGDTNAIQQDIAAVVAASHAGGAICKVILENVLLTDEEKVTACKIAQAAGADFVKTSTGFNAGGATVADIRLMRETVGPDMGVKAAGGVRTLADAKAMVEAGATRIGASAGVALIAEARGETTRPNSEGY